MVALVFGPPKDELPYGVVYIPPATSGKGAKVVVLPKKLFPNPLDKVPIDTPPEFFFPPLSSFFHQLRLTHLLHRFRIPSQYLQLNWKSQL
jgi:hypothetical protein